MLGTKVEILTQMIDEVNADVLVKEMSKVDGRQRMKQFAQDKKDFKKINIKIVRRNKVIIHCLVQLL